MNVSIFPLLWKGLFDLPPGMSKGKDKVFPAKKNRGWRCPLRQFVPSIHLFSLLAFLTD